jgi:hypothetical protein
MPRDDSGCGGCLLVIFGLVLLEDHPIIGIILILIAMGL